MHTRNAVYCVLAIVALSALLLGSAPVTAMSALTGIGDALVVSSETQGYSAGGESQGLTLTEQNTTDIDGDGVVDILGSDVTDFAYRKSGGGESEPMFDANGSADQTVSFEPLSQATNNKSLSNSIRILFDQAHENINIGAEYYNYSDFVASLTSNGYAVDALTSPVTLKALHEYDLFVVPAVEIAFSSDPISYTSSEIAALQTYVQQGGSLFLICDYHSDEPGRRSNAAERELSAAFGVTLDANIATDPTDHIGGHDFWITFHVRNFTNHPIMQGVNELQSFASATMSGPATSLVTTDPDATPTSKSVGLTLNYGNGEVAIVGDSNYFGESNISYINYEDNRQFGLNIVSWLTRRRIFLPLVLRNH